MIGPLLSAVSGNLIPSWVKWAALFIVGLAIGATVNGWRLGEKIETMEKEKAQVTATAQELARTTEAHWAKQLQEAQNAAKITEQTHRAAADRARNAADRLRGKLADIQRDLPGLAADACRQRANTLATVFGQCVERHRSLGEICDRHVTDKVMLMSAWPKN